MALLALDLGEPWSCHQKYKVMDESHSKIFGRSDVTGAKVALFFELISKTEDHSDDFEDDHFGHYALTKYFLAYIVSEIISDSEKGRKLLSTPDSIVKDGNADKFTKIFGDLVATAIDDLEAEVSELKEDGAFDYKRDLKSPKWCRSMANKIKATYKKDVKRKKAVDIDDLLKGL